MMPAVAASSPETVDVRKTCRLCGAQVRATFVDLGMSPLCESFVPPERFDEMEPFFPLHARVCDGCRLVQLAAFVSPDEIFREYAYFSSFSASWVEHARRYVNEVIERLALGPASFVVELASNDGYLLRHFLGTEIRILGIEPAINVAAAAERIGVPTLTEFFGVDTAKAVAGEHGHADLIVGNNVLAQVPDLNDFVAGVAVLLAERGTATFEFPHLLHLIDGLQYDTIYHEHFSYFSLATATRAMNRHGLDVYDVEEIPTHGGSLRLYVGHKGVHDGTERLAALVRRELQSKLDDPRTYADFAERVRESKRALLSLLIELRRDGRQVVGYGAPGKGNTLLNYCGIRTDFLDYTVDRNPYKHGMQLPGSRIPIFDTTQIAETKPDYVLVLPWNLIDEISAQLSYVAEWGGKLIVPIPTAEIREPGGAA